MQNLDQEWRELTDRYGQMTDEELEILANDAYDLTDMARGILQNEIALRKLKIKLVTEPPAVPGSPADAVVATAGVKVAGGDVRLVAGGAVRPVKEYDVHPIAGSAVQSVARNAAHPISDDAIPQGSDDVDFDPEDLDLVKIDPVWDMEDARRVKGILDGYGVPSYYGPDDTEDVQTLGPAFAAAATEAARRGYEVGIDVKVPRRYRDQAFRAFANWAADQPPSDPDPIADADYAAQCPKCHSPEIVFEGLDGSAPDPADASFKWHCDKCGNTWSDDGVEEARSS